MRGVGFPSLEEGYRFISKYTDLDVARGTIDPKAPIMFTQEEPEEVERDYITHTAPIMIRNKDYQVLHGILFCGNTMAWMHNGELWIRHNRWTWNGKDCLTVSAYDAIKAILAENA